MGLISNQVSGMYNYTDLHKLEQITFQTREFHPGIFDIYVYCPPVRKLQKVLGLNYEFKELVGDLATVLRYAKIDPIDIKILNKFGQVEAYADLNTLQYHLLKRSSRLVFGYPIDKRDLILDNIVSEVEKDRDLHTNSVITTTYRLADD